MTTTHTTIRLAPETRRKLDQLAEVYGTRTAAIAVAVDRLHKETPMTDYSDIFGRDVSPRDMLLYYVRNETSGDFAAWLRQQALDLYGGTEDWVEHDWQAIARDITRSAFAA